MSHARIRRGLTAVVAAAALLIPGTAAATPPVRYTFEADQTFFAPQTSAVCGFDVYVRVQGTAHVILFLGPDGTSIVREIDWNSGWTETLTAPDLGTSYTQRTAGPLITWYPEGTDIGDPATAMLVGSNGRIGDDPAEAGHLVWDAVVVFVDPVTDIPGIDFVNLVAAHGHFIGDNIARRCAALAS